MRLSAASSLFAAVLTLVTASVNAQDKGQVQEQAKTLEAQLRALGEPRDRCSIGANIYEGLVVVRTEPTSVLKPGDKLLSMNQVPLTGKSVEDVINLIREFEPTASLAVKLDRHAEILDVQVPCTNARVVNEPFINALSFAAKGAFDECVSSLDQVSNPDTRNRYLKVQCASVSRNPKKYVVPYLTLEALQMAIEDAQYAVGMRAEVVTQMRNLEGMITETFGRTRF